MFTLPFLLFAFPAGPATLPATAPPDSIAPSQITDFVLQDFEPDSIGATFVLKWTAPGDDGHTGSAWRYEMRIACGGLDEALWPDAISLTDILDLPDPKEAAAPESLSLAVGGLDPDTDYAIGLKAIDEAGHYGPLSDVVTFHTTGSSRDFSETIFLNGLDVWAWGHHIAGDSLVARYTGCEFSLGGVARPSRGTGVRARSTDGSWEQTLRKIPYIQSLTGRGMSFSEAKRSYYREQERLYNKAEILMNADSISAAQTLLEQSPLVDSTWVSDRSISVKMVGKDGRHILYVDNSGVLPGAKAESRNSERTNIVLGSLIFGADKARQAVEIISSHTRFADRKPCMLFVSRLGISFLGGNQQVAQIKAQLAWLLDKHTSNGMPEGPLHEPTISEILEANPGP